MAEANGNWYDGEAGLQLHVETRGQPLRRGPVGTSTSVRMLSMVRHCCSLFVFAILGKLNFRGYAYTLATFPSPATTEVDADSS